MEGDEGHIFIKAPGWKPLFLRNLKIKQNLGCPNKGYNAIFCNIHQSTKASPRSRNNLH